MRFKHARFIVGSPEDGTARPEVYEVSKVQQPRPDREGAIWYRTPGSTAPAFVIAAREFGKIVKEWVD